MMKDTVVNTIPVTLDPTSFKGDQMDAKIKDTYFMKLGSCMDINKEELDKIACQIEQVINTNFPHIRVHIGDIEDLETVSMCESIADAEEKVNNEE